MAIIRPITEGQVEIALSTDDGERYYRGAFISSSPFEAKLDDQKVTYSPIVVSSSFDPVYYKDLLNYCIDYLGTKKGSEDSFTLHISIRFCAGNSVLAEYTATGCKLVGYSLPNLDRESGKVAQFSLTFQPSGISRVLT